MPLPIPVPSKAAIHALRGIAFGTTSCAIGVILEDRRRRIDLLRTAVSNGEKIKAAKRYYGVSALEIPQEDADSLEGIGSHWRPQNDTPLSHERPKKYRDFTLPDEGPQKNPAQPPAPSIEPETVETPSPLTATRTIKPKTKLSIPSMKVPKSSQVDIASIKKAHSKAESATAINTLLERDDEQGLDQALTKFFDGSRLLYSSKNFDEEWVAISAKLSTACQAKSRLNDAGKVLATTVSAGLLDEYQYYDHNPFSIIKFYLEQEDGDGRCPPEAIAVATQIFLAKFKDKPQLFELELQDIGRRLFTYNMSTSHTNITHRIYWRIVGSAANPTKFIGWVIQELFLHKDYRNVIRYFLLNFSKTSPTTRCYNETVDCVISSVEELKGHKEKQVLEALVRMDRPGKGFLRTRWIMKTLQACWHRNQDFAAVKEIFDGILSLGLMDKVAHPQGVYRTMVEISVKAKEYDLARSYCEVLIEKYPSMLDDVALRGFLALAAADAGNWDTVFDAFTEMKTLKEGQEDEYDNAFILVLKVFAQTHPAAEVRDFVSKYTTDLGVRMHRYAVTLVANKFGQCRDVPGFISWLAYCCKAGFALDSGVCNSILYNCWAVFKLSYPELLEVYSKIRRLGPSLTDDVTRRIMSQAATAAGRVGKRINPNRGVHSRATIMNELTYRGRMTNQRDVYEAMNQELHSGRPVTAIRIFKQALGSGMPSCEHCLRLAVIASSRSPKHGSDYAMTLIRAAYERGTDVTSAIAAFIKFRLEQLQASAQDLLIHMRNLVSQFEAINVILQPGVFTQMAMMVIDVGHFERGISLCTFAMNQYGFKNFAFSRQSIRAMLTAFSKLRDMEGLRKLCRDISESKYVADKFVLSYLRSARRIVAKFQEEAAGRVMLKILEHTIGKLVKERAEARIEGATIAQETLRIMQEAVSDMQESLKLEISDDPTDPKPQQPRI